MPDQERSQPSPSSRLSSLTQIENQLAAQILQGAVQIASHSTSIRSLKHSKEDSYNSRIRQIQELKGQMLAEMQSLKQEEQELRNASPDKKSNKLERSFFTKEDKMKIKEAQRLADQRNRKIKQRMEEIMANIQRRESQLLQQKQLALERKKQQRLKKIVERRHYTENMRKESNERLNKSHIGMKKDNYVYVRNMKRDRLLEKEQQRYESVLLRERKERFKVNFDEIRKHAIEHDESLEKSKQMRFKELEQQIKSRVKSMGSVPKTRTMQRIKEQIQHSKAEKQQQINQKREVRERIVNFRKHVASHYKPRISEKSKFILPKPQQTLSPSHSERLEKGNNYLLEARRLAKKPDPSKETSFETLPTESLAKKYPNYIPDVREQNKNKYKHNMDIESLVKGEKVSWVKTEKAVELMRQKESKVKKNDYESVKEKLALLSCLMSLEA